jgi:hypothetical protein
MAVKVLVCGDTNGNFKSLFLRVEKLQKKHDFSVLFCVGTFFSDKLDCAKQLGPYLCGEEKVPMPTYFIMGADKHTDAVDDKAEGGELCPNLHYLGRAGVKEVGGLRVAYLSGVYDPVFFKVLALVNLLSLIVLVSCP